jgi:hypothetical protein
MFQDKYKGNKFNRLAQMHKSYSAKGETLNSLSENTYLSCPVVQQYEQSKKCQHINKMKKFLFTSTYHTCIDCGEEL